jgi:hypothetical protein
LVSDNGVKSTEKSSSIENPQYQDGTNNDPARENLIDFDGGVAAGLPPGEQTAPDPQCTAAWLNLEAGICCLGVEPALLLPPLMWMWRRRSSDH